MLLEYLNSSKQIEILSHLISKIASYPLETYEFFIPQLLSLSFHNPGSNEIHRILLSASIDSHLFALSLHGHLSAFICASSEEKKESIESLLESLEMVIVNARLPKHFSSSAPPHFFDLPSEDSEIDGFNRKSIRSNYYSYQMSIIQLLCKISVGLNQVPNDERNSKLELWLKSVNKTIKNTRELHRNCNKSEQKLFRGPVIGLRFFNEPDDEPAQVVRVHFDKSLCFSTKSRVPFKLILETIAVDEESHSDHQTINSAPEDIPFDLNTLDIEGIDKTLDKNDRFKGYSEFVQGAEKGLDYLKSRKESDSFEVHDQEVWGESWEDLKKKIRESSEWGAFSSWKLRGVIVKGLDDLRQEYLAMQLIIQIKQIWDEAHLSLYLRPYEIRVISHYMGMIEYIPNALSIHSIKKTFPNFTSLREFFEETWSNSFEEAQRNFVRSMAGYSLLSYILSIKDRHNANILIDSKGHVIHIDFGFFLTTSPGNLGFESAPFKLNHELVQVMGGLDGEMFGFFKILLLQGFLEVRKHVNNFMVTVSAMGADSGMECLGNFEEAVEGIKDRLQLGLTDEKCMAFIEDLVYQSTNNWRTDKYDDFQYLTNGIL
jgi:phosphatidylinositol 4-kinase